MIHWNTRTEEAKPPHRNRRLAVSNRGRTLRLLAWDKDRPNGVSGTCTYGLLYTPKHIKESALGGSDADSEQDSHFHVSDLDSTHLKGLHIRFGGALSYVSYRQVIYKQLLTWAEEAFPTLLRAVCKLYPDAEKEDAERSVCSATIRLSYVLTALVIDGSVHIPSILCSIEAPTDKKTVYISPMVFAEEYKTVTCDGVCYDFSLKYTIPCVINFKGDLKPNGCTYLHLTLDCHKKYGTPIKHTRTCDPKSVMVDATNVPEHRAAPYKFNPSSYTCALDMFIYPPFLADIYDQSVMWCRISSPEKLFGKQPRTVYEMRKYLPLVPIINDGKYIFPTQWEDELIRMSDSDRQTIAEYFHI